MSSALLYDLVMRPMGRLGLTRLREELLEGLRGQRVLELGAGTGLLSWAGRGALEVVGVDIDEGALARARRRNPNVRYLCADAQSLPFPDASFDVVVASLVLCSVPRPDAALAEVRRVLRPGGELRLLEHIRGDRSPRLAKALDLLAPAWAALSGGCHLNRRTPELVEHAGFQILSREEHTRGLVVLLRAVRPGAAGGQAPGSR